MNVRRQPRSGFTLIEVLLAVALSVALMALLGGAINLYLLRVDESRTEVEQAQLARGVLRLIVDDIRALAMIPSQDTSSAADAAASQSLFDVDQADQQPVEETSLEQTRPDVGIHGDLQTIQIDVLRLRPSFKVDPANPSQAMTMGYLSPGITGVRYFLTEAGLVREQAGRDVTIQQEQQGLAQSWEQSRRVIAPEVVDLRFRYNDGTQVLEMWDLEERAGALPAAVEIRVGFRPADIAADQPYPTSDVRYYRIVAPVPSAAGGEESSADLSSPSGEAS